MECSAQAHYSSYINVGKNLVPEHNTVPTLCREDLVPGQCSSYISVALNLPCSSVGTKALLYGTVEEEYSKSHPDTMGAFFGSKPAPLNNNYIGLSLLAFFLLSEGLVLTS